MYEKNIYAFKREYADFDTDNYSNRENISEVDTVITSMKYINTHRD